LPVSSYAAKNLRVTFVLTNNAANFSQGGNTLVIQGLRVEVTTQSSGLPAIAEATARIYGMAQAEMNVMTSLQVGATQGLNANLMQIDADSGDGFTTIFSGQIVNAQPDYTGSPEVCLVILARFLALESLLPTAALSFTGTASAASIASAIVSAMGKGFFNNGVTAQLSNQYLPGSGVEQLRALCDAVNIEFYEDPSGQFITIAPVGTPHSVPAIILSPDSGLVGYPTVDSLGYLQVRSLFNPSYVRGNPITIQGSDVIIDLGANNQAIMQRANGNWMIASVRHTVDSIKFGGNWFSDLVLYPPASAPPNA
jgi:hypothetical protein